MTYKSNNTRFFCTSSFVVLSLALMTQMTLAQGTVVVPVGRNVEPTAANVLDSGVGFAITLDTVPTPTTNAKETRRSDIALAQAGFDVRYDGLETDRRLDLQILNEGSVRAGDRIRLQGQANYLAFVERAEFRVIDLAAEGGPSTLQVVQSAPNGTVQITVPEGENIVVVHRVYDAQGRFDQTAGLPLSVRENRPILDDDAQAIELGTSTLVKQSIPIFGGSVTVSGTNVTPGGRVQVLGETVTASSDGSFVLQRILPPGDQTVTIRPVGPVQGVYFERDLTIPKNEWFYTGTADLTFGRRLGDLETTTGATLPRNYNHGRIAGFATGRTQNGWTITASADTGERELKNLFRDFDGKDPQDLLLRLTAENSYPMFGDDSTIEDAAPTRGKFYLKAEKNGNHVLWGNYKSTISGSHYLRNERDLYGAQAVYKSPEQTQNGDARFSVEAYAASPDRLPARDAFRGTGGSIYFLNQQDISVASETLSIELRDGLNGRLVETRTLVEGRDYVINYIQGVITLVEPLNSTSSTGAIVTSPNADLDVFLVAQYEFTPVGTDIDGLSYGARAEGWVSDQLRIGATGIVEQTGIADQSAVGVDLRWQYSERSFAELEYAETSGPGFASTVSSDGGLIVTTNPTTGTSGGTGTALRFNTQVDLEDLSAAVPGTIGAYYENRTAGFSTLDYQVANDQELWGLSFDIEPSEDLTFRFAYDDYRDTTGKSLKEGELSVGYKVSEKINLDFGVAHLEKATPLGAATENGIRTDVAARVTVQPSDDFKYYVFGQKTVKRSGGLRKNDRYGVGAELKFNDNWSVQGEVSDGTLGVGGDVKLSYQSGPDRSAYVGYRLEPGRDFAGVTLLGRDAGTWVAGGRRKVSESVDFFGENTFDNFGRHKSLTSAYGVEYRATEALTFSTAIEVGQVDDGPEQFDRHALSLGIRYSEGENIDANVRIELRHDDGTIGGVNRDADSYLLAAAARYKIDEDQRLLFDFEYSDTISNNASFASGTYADLVLGYAYRPIDNDRLNLLFQYRYLYDMVGQELDGVSTRGPRQESHIASVDLNYDISNQWTLGGKLGGRWSYSSPNNTTPLTRNDAWLAVLNARYHATHKWDILLEARHLEAKQAGLSETGFVGAAYRHIGNNVKLGIGYNFASFSDDLSDLTLDDKGIFVNFVAKF
ncbi:hypothetical protein Q4544_13965 [Cognatishimia sp. 1_MG-2023]|uniref:hypothetical protein n=1 Tax=Cognatishimia sp. 1_MG-2023 TaxID=3062642 RepID=UPI0026E46BEB|nr:hypothetical protein [Cognatishimia sp. 1_MG-2023]MDO6728043.1 hypothetical protein [Cognatishimia sp. 1_MG-2023]